MITPCKKATNLVSESRDRRLAVGERIALLVHLLLCHPCRRFRSQLAKLGDIARSAADRDEVSAEGLSPVARDRIRDAIAARDR